MQRAESVPPATQPIPLTMIFLAALAVHAPLLLMKLPLKTYDANFHIFFASHYLHNWFDPWNPKWYAGFSQTTYPPLPQQWLALVSRVIGLDMAYMVIQFVAILLLALGVYRFSMLWVNRRAASFAALASVFLEFQDAHGRGTSDLLDGSILRPVVHKKDFVRDILQRELYFPLEL